jgi:DNA-binding MarR family transcriptional regulator
MNNRGLAAEIKQNKPFGSLEQEATLSIQRTAAELEHAFAEALKPFGITPTQYNVLRILRGAGKNGLCRSEVADRMVTKVPDVTRLLDRMEVAGLIERRREGEDRRYVSTFITDYGLELLADLDGPVAQLHVDRLGHLSRAQLATLIELLGHARKAE